MASKTYEFKMDMTCEGCANAAKKVLGKQESAVTNVVTNVADKTVIVTSTLPSDELLAILQKTGKKIEFVGEK